MTKETTPAAPASNAPATPPGNPLEALASALQEAGVSMTDEDASSTAVKPDDKPAEKPKRLKDLGAYAKLTDDELYGIEVPSAVEGAEPYTIGKLKDLAKAHDDFTLHMLTKEQQFRDRDAALLRTEQELRELFAALPESAIKPELRKSLQDKRDKVATEERQRVLEAIPEWQNRDIRTRELGAMVEHLKGYGFQESFLAGVVDHRMVRYIRANMTRDAQIKAALEKVQALKSKTPPKASKTATPAPKSGTKPTMKTHEQRQLDNFSSVLFNNTRR